MTLRERVENVAHNLRQATKNETKRIDAISSPITTIAQMHQFVAAEVEYAIKNVLAVVLTELEAALKEDEQEGGV